MKKNNDDWLSKLHLEEVKILDELDRVCRENNLQYFLTGGTLIGAVRHKGFIPWDDDIDVGMPRKDYKKLIKLYSNKKDGEFYLDSFKNEKKSFRLYAKLKLKNTLFVEGEIGENQKVDHGIWIDIFPYDNIENLNSKKHLKQNKIRNYISKMVCLKFGMTNYLSEYRKSHKVLMLFVDLFIKICPSKLMLAYAERVISSNKDDDSKYIGTMTGSLSLEKETHLRNDVFPLTKLEFEGKKYYCPKEYDKLLTKIYGDYMKLPPVDKRVTHRPMKIVFSDGEEVNFEESKK